MFKHHNLFAVLFVLFVLVLMVAPVAAQSTAAQETGAEPVTAGEGNLYVVDQAVVIGGLFVVLTLMGLLGTSLALLYRSAPPMVQEMTKMIAEVLMKQLDKVVESTSNVADDALRDMIREVMEDILLKNEGVTIAESVMKAECIPVDDAIFGANSKGSDDMSLGDPVPAGG